MRILFVNLIFLAFAMTAVADPKISFTVSFKEPQAHYAEVKMDISNIREDYVDVKMPVWTPGSYLVREYARHVESFEACYEDGKLMEVQKISKNTWRIFSKKAPHIRVNYRIYGFEVSVRTNFIDDSHAFLSPAATFMYVDGHIDQSAEVTVVPHANWSKVSTGLEPVTGKPNTFFASDFDILFDSPIEVGNQHVFTFEAAGVHHEVAMVGGGNYDEDRLIRDFTVLIEECTRIFGVNPNKRFVFIVHHYHSGRGGLEHLNSTVLGATRNGYTNERTYMDFLGLVAHEYFHLWHVKRLRPIELGPFNYEEENYTTALWIIEGFTSYFDNLILRRTDMVSEDTYLQLLSSDVNTVENRPGNQIQPVALASLDAWIKFYRPDENTANTSISYYNKGALLAMLMDVKIIAASNGKKSLDDVMKAAYQEFYVEKKRGFTEAEFQELIERVGGVSVAEVFEAAHTVKPLDYNAYLNPVGYQLVDYMQGRQTPDIGVTTQATDGRLMVTGVVRSSGAWEGGLNVRDEIISVNGERMDAAGKELTQAVQRTAIGEKLSVLVARDGLIRELDIEVKADSKGSFSIVPVRAATPEQQRLGQVWLSLD